MLKWHCLYLLQIKGYLDDVELNRITVFEHELQAYAHTYHAEFMKEINKTGDYNDDVIATI